MINRAILFIALFGFANLASGSGSHESGRHTKGAHWAAPKDAAQRVNPVPPVSVR